VHLVGFIIRKIEILKLY